MEWSTCVVVLVRDQEEFYICVIQFTSVKCGYEVFHIKRKNRLKKKKVPVINFWPLFYSCPTAVYFQDQFIVQRGLRSSNINQEL